MSTGGSPDGTAESEAETGGGDPPRFGLEPAPFAAAVAALGVADRPAASAGLAAPVAVHYALDVNRIRWLRAGDRTPAGPARAAARTRTL